MLVGTPGLLADTFADLEKQFERSHAEYTTWLRRRMAEVLLRDEFRQIAKEFELDWATLHYVTRHSTAAATSQEHVHAAVPYETYMDDLKNILNVYVSTESPYISFFSQDPARQGDPKCIYIHEGDSAALPRGWLGVDAGLAECLASITTGAEPQGELTPVELERCMRSGRPETLESVNAIHERFSKWALRRKESWTPAESLALFRNTCRVTLRGMREAPNTVCPPRKAILCPAYVENNLIGGIAYIGPGLPTDALGARSLSFLAAILLTGLRLREEPRVAMQLGQMQELNKARAFFVQRLAHSIQGPADALVMNVRRATTALKQVQDEIQQLSEAANEIMMAFSKERAADIVRVKRNEVAIKEFVETVIFANSQLYDRAELSLEMDDVPEGWRIWLDETEFYEVISNLVRNARRFAKKKVRITVERREAPVVYVFRVRDDGPGVAPSIVSRLFQPGVRAPSPRDDETSHGYGLYLSAQTLERIGGKIYLNKQCKVGAEFVVEAPEGAPAMMKDEKPW